MHREIMKPSKVEVIDHINHNKLDNTKENLRCCTKQQNEMNKVKRSNTSSKFKGVTKINKWMASITFNNKTINLGYFNTEKEAAKIYNVKAKELFGEFAYLNEV